MSNPTLLIVDDEPQLIRVLRPSFLSAGYEVSTASSGSEALSLLHDHTFDAIILDLGLPDQDGKEVIVQARAVSSAPIIVLSARDGENEKIAALDNGANDFVNKPFNIGELLARIRVALRPAAARSADFIQIGHLDIDFRTRRMRVNGHDVRPSPRELKLLRLFVDHIEDTLTYKHIVASVWGEDKVVEPQFVRVLVGNLRQKIELDPRKPSLIQTVPGIGYCLRRPA